jgi:hypothetical protein
MKTLIASLFLALCCTAATAADVTCANGVCTKAKNAVITTGSATKQVVKTTVRPIRRVIRGR